MKLILLTLLILFQIYCVNPKDNKNRNLLFGALLLSQGNFQFSFANNSPNPTRGNATRSSNTGLVRTNLSGINPDFYGDGTSDGYADKFADADGVEISVGNVFFYKAIDRGGMVPPGQETNRNYDAISFVAREFLRNQSQLPNLPPLLTATVQISSLNSVLSANLPSDIFTADYDRIAIDVHSFYYTYSPKVFPEPGPFSVSVINTFYPRRPDSSGKKAYSVESYLYNQCNENGPFRVQDCVMNRRNPSASMNPITPIDINTGFYDASNYSLTLVALPSLQRNDRLLSAPFGNENPALNSYVRNSNNPDDGQMLNLLQNTSTIIGPPEQTPSYKGNLVILKINKSVSNPTKLRIVVDASNVFFWDSNSNSTQFRPNKYPNLDADGKFSGSDPWVNPPDFRTWNNPEAPIPSIGKDIKLYLPVMYAVME